MLQVDDVLNDRCLFASVSRLCRDCIIVCLLSPILSEISCPWSRDSVYLLHSLVPRTKYMGLAQQATISHCCMN